MSNIYLINSKENRDKLISLGWKIDFVVAISENTWPLLHFVENDLKKKIYRISCYDSIQGKVLTINKIIEYYCKPKLKDQLKELKDLILSARMNETGNLQNGIRSDNIRNVIQLLGEFNWEELK